MEPATDEHKHPEVEASDNAPVDEFVGDEIVGDIEDSNLDDSYYTEVISLWRSPLAQIPSFCIFIALAILAVYYTTYEPWALQYIQVTDAFALPIPLFALPVILVGVYILHRLYDRRYELGINYIRAIEGLLSVNKKETRIELPDIRGVEIQRTLYGRLLNIGNLMVGSAMHEQVEIEFRDIYDPSTIRDIIRRRRKRLHRKDLEHLEIHLETE